MTPPQMASRSGLVVDRCIPSPDLGLFEFEGVSDVLEAHVLVVTKDEDQSVGTGQSVGLAHQGVPDGGRGAFGQRVLQKGVLHSLDGFEVTPGFPDIMWEACGRVVHVLRQVLGVPGRAFILEGLRWQFHRFISFLGEQSYRAVAGRLAGEEHASRVERLGVASGVHLVWVWQLIDVLHHVVAMSGGVPGELAHVLDREDGTGGQDEAQSFEGG